MREFTIVGLLLVSGYFLSYDKCSLFNFESFNEYKSSNCVKNLDPIAIEFNWLRHEQILDGKSI